MKRREALRAITVGSALFATNLSAKEIKTNLEKTDGIKDSVLSEANIKGYVKTQVEPKKALELLEYQNSQLIKTIVKTADNVYTAVGYHGANVSMIVGDDGIIIIDTLMGHQSASNAFKAFRQISDKPVKAIIYTHSHPDHIGGASAFYENDNIPIYAMENFGSTFKTNKLLAPSMKARNLRQFGRMLKPEYQTNRGVAPAVTIDHDVGKGYIEPTIRVNGNDKITISGVNLHILKSPGETDDALFIWLEKEKVLFAGDNFYNSFPNLYAIRGTPYRDVLQWSQSVAKMAEFEPEFLIPGHTMPIIGKEKAVTALKDYSQAISEVYYKTIDGINQGKSANQIANELELSTNLSNKPYLREYYGSISHAVRAIYDGLFGWFDGNPTNLNPFPPLEKALNLANLAGGAENLYKSLEEAMSQKNYQWALELSDALSWLEYKSDKAKKMKILALRELAKREYNAPNRNYYLSYADELESGKLDKKWF